MGHARFGFALERLQSGTRTGRRTFLMRDWMLLPLVIVPLRLVSCSRVRLTRTGWFYRNSGTPRFTQSDGDRLLRRFCSVLSFADVLDLFVNKFSCRSGGGFTLLEIFLCSIYRYLFWHIELLQWHQGSVRAGYFHKSSSAGQNRSSLQVRWPALLCWMSQRAIVPTPRSYSAWNNLRGRSVVPFNTSTRHSWLLVSIMSARRRAAEMTARQPGFFSSLVNQSGLVCTN
jgi:hypothetical protein